MNRGEVQQMMGANWWNTIMRLPPPTNSPPSSYNNFATPPSSYSYPFSHIHNNNQDLTDSSWSHLLMSGMMCEEEEKKLEMSSRWEEEQEQEQEKSSGDEVYGSSRQQDHIWPQIQLPTPSPMTTTTFSNNFLDFSNNNINNKTTDPIPDPSSQCNSSRGTGGAFKKARVQPSTTQSSSTFKVVRKEKLGDRITALHQLVSPFGKTDTASVLLEAIGYIRFLQTQIEALSSPYLASGTGNARHQQPSAINNNAHQGENNSLFPEDPGQLVNENCLKRKAAACGEQQEYCEEVDLKSRGLCLIPVSCTQQVGSDNGAYY